MKNKKRLTLDQVGDDGGVILHARVRSPDGTKRSTRVCATYTRGRHHARDEPSIRRVGVGQSGEIQSIRLAPVGLKKKHGVSVFDHGATPKIQE